MLSIGLRCKKLFYYSLPRGGSNFISMDVIRIAVAAVAILFALMAFGLAKKISQFSRTGQLTLLAFLLPLIFLYHRKIYIILRTLPRDIRWVNKFLCNTFLYLSYICINEVNNNCNEVSIAILIKSQLDVHLIESVYKQTAIYLHEKIVSLCISTYI